MSNAEPNEQAGADMCFVPAATFRMGSDHHYPEEAPAHVVAVDGFWMDRYAVTNRDFERFVRATGYVTLAERPVDPALYPGAQPELLVPSSVVFVNRRGRSTCATRTTGGGTLRVRTGVTRAAREARCRACGITRSFMSRSRTRPPSRMGRKKAAYRSGVGARSPRRPRSRGVRLGRRAGAERPIAGQHLAGRVSVAEHKGRRLRMDGSSRIVSAERLRPSRDGRQRLGVDDGLVPEQPRGRYSGLLCPKQSQRRQARRQLRSSGADQDSPQGHEGRLVPLRAELLPSLSACSAHGAADRHRHMPSGLPLYRAVLGAESNLSEALEDR